MKSKTKRNVIFWVFVIIALAIMQYYLIMLYSGTTNSQRVKEDRNMTVKEITYFNNLFLENPGFIRNFYESPADISLPEILFYGQATDLTKELTIDQKRSIVSSDLVMRDDYATIYASPNKALNIIVDAKKARDLFEEKTNIKYTKTSSSEFWVYNQKYDVYYNSNAYGFEGSYPNDYEFNNIKIIADDKYHINYTAYYIMEEDNPLYEGHSPNSKEELYSGILTIKKVGSKYLFISNIITEHKLYISMIELLSNDYDFDNVIDTKSYQLTDYYDFKTHEVELQKFKHINNLNDGYAIKVIPKEETLETEIFYFGFDKKLKMYQTIKDNLNTYYYFTNNQVDAMYKKLKNNEFEFAAYTDKIRLETTTILEKVSKVKF